MKKFTSRWLHSRKSKDILQNEIFLQNLQATVLVVQKSRLVPTENGYTITPGATLQESMFLCPDDPRSQETPLGTCTGIILYFYWVVLPSSCLDESNKNDYVLVKRYRKGITFLQTSDVIPLNDVIIKPPTDDQSNLITILELPTYDLSAYFMDNLASSPLNTPIYIMGYPYGLHESFVFGTIVEETSPESMKIQATSFGLAPGSPVFDMESHLLVGILKSGGKAYQLDKERECLVSLSETNTQDVIGTPGFLFPILTYVEKNIEKVQEAALAFTKQ